MAKKSTKSNKFEEEIEGNNEGKSEGSDEYDDLESEVNADLEEAGIDTTAQKQYILLKKNEDSHKFDYVSTSDVILPMDAIGKKFGGGDFQLKVRAGGKIRKSRSFSISKDVFPEPETEEEEEDIEDEPVRRRFEPVGRPIQPIAPAGNDITQMLLLKLIDKMTDKKDTDLLTVLSKAKELGLLGNQQSGLDSRVMSEMIGNTFNAGMKLAMESMDNKGRRDWKEIMSETLANMVDGLDVNKIVGNIMAKKSVQPVHNVNQVTTGNAEGTLLKAPVEEVKAETSMPDFSDPNFMLIVDIFVNQVILNFINGVEAFVSAESLHKVSNFKLVKGLIDYVNNDEQIITQILSSIETSVQEEHVTAKNDPEFKNYLKEILDSYHNYDTLLIERENDNADEDETDNADEEDEEDEEEITKDKEK